VYEMVEKQMVVLCFIFYIIEIRETIKGYSNQSKLKN